MRRKVSLVALVAALSSFGLFGTATPAQASCTEIVDDGGCIETVICRAASKLGDCVQ